MFYLIFLVCQYLRWVQYARNRVHWTHFVRLENEFNELGFYSCKPSSLNSVCFKLCIRGNHRKTLQAHKKTNTLKKLSSNFKRYTIPSHSQSLPLTRSRALSHSHTLIPSLSLRCRHCRGLLPSPSLPLASVGPSPRRLVFLPQWLANYLTK